MELELRDKLAPIMEKYKNFLDPNHGVWLITQTELHEVVKVRKDLGIPLPDNFSWHCGSCFPSIIKPLYDIYVKL